MTRKFYEIMDGGTGSVDWQKMYREKAEDLDKSSSLVDKAYLMGRNGYGVEQFNIFKKSNNLSTEKDSEIEIERLKVDINLSIQCIESSLRWAKNQRLDGFSHWLDVSRFISEFKDRNKQVEIAFK